MDVDLPRSPWRAAAVVRTLPRGLGRIRLTPVLLPVVYRAVIVTAVLAGLAGVVLAAATAWWLGLLAVLVAPPLVLGTIVLARIGAELTLAVLTVTDHVAELAAGLPRLESTMDDVASDMPPLGFLRRNR